MRKLTEKQASALREVEAGDVRYRKYGTGAWRLCCNSNPSVIGRLRNLGLIDLPFPGKARLTEKGRTALAELA